MSNKIAKWKKWVAEICTDCGYLMLNREMFNDLRAMIQKNPKMQQADYFHDYMKDTYVVYTTIMLRRHLKNDSNSISLSTLVSDILENKDQIIGFSLFSELQDRLNNFAHSTAKIESFADRQIAHLDKKPPSYTPTYNDIDDAMDSLCILCEAILNDVGMETCKPTVQDGWLDIFREMGIET
jgi:uncharacterized protein YutD